MEKKNKKNETVEKKIRISTVVYSFLIMVIVIFGAMCVLAYGTNTNVGNRIAGVMSKAVPFPAAFVGYSNIIYLKDVEANLASLQKFYATKDFSDSGLRVDFSTEDGKKRLMIKEREILNKMIEDRAIEVLSKKRGVGVSRQDLDAAVAKKIAESGTADELKADLLKNYGWTLSDFKDKVVFPEVYRQALADAVESEVLDNTAAKNKIQEAQKELLAGKDFSQVASIYSEGDSKTNGGEIGWVGKEQVLPELQEQLFGDKALEKFAITESSLGFHIVEIENKKKNGNDDVVQIRQIFVRKPAFSDWLSNEMNKMKIMIPLSGFRWDSSTSRVEFRDETMSKFEKDSRDRAEGDASIMF
jgi:parvulin-like peptidyl-prolyl isomerase